MTASSAFPAVQPFDPSRASATQRLAVGQLFADCYAATYPEDPPLVPLREAEGLLHVTPGEVVARFVVWDGEQAAAYAHLDYSQTQNLHAAQAQLLVHPDHRRRGLGRALVEVLTAEAQAQGRRHVTFFTTNLAPSGEAFARFLGATPALTNRTSRLLLGEVSPELLREWQQRPAGDPYVLHVWDTIPADYLARAAAVMMVMNTAPRGEGTDDWTITPDMVSAWEKQTQDSGERRLMLAVEDRRTGELVGYSETYWGPERASLVYQGATAVHPSARGQGLGKWLKAAMLAKIPSEYPSAEYVRTGNAEENAAMLGINVALGFRPWAQTTEWQMVRQA